MIKLKDLMQSVIFLKIRENIFLNCENLIKIIINWNKTRFNSNKLI